MTPSNDAVVQTELSSTAGRHTFVRVGTWLWRLPAGVREDNGALIASLVEALRTDARVESIQLPPQDDYWTVRRSMYPDFPRTNSQGLSTGTDSFEALDMSRHVRFKVRVPVKNQTAPHGDPDQIPSDTYHVAWNGISVFVLWEQLDDYPPLAGGHVVAEVLDDALDSIGSELYVQNCSPGCNFMFTHTPLRLVEDSTVETFELGVSATLDPSVPMRLAWRDELEDDVETVAMWLGSVVGEFAAFKNIGRRLIDLEADCRIDLAHVLGHINEHSQLIANGRSVENLKQRWSVRGWRKEARALVASIWLALANMETLRRSWDRDRADLAVEAELLTLFKQDFARDVQSVEALQLDPIAATVNQIAVTLDNRTMVAATGWGALAGGVAGGLAGLLR